jgi:hypothetical protein
MCIQDKDGSMFSPTNLNLDTYSPSESLVNSVFLINRGNHAFVAGKSLRPENLRSAIGCMIVIVPIILIFTWASLYDVLNETRIQNDLRTAGKVVRAEIIDHRTQESDESTSYYVTYRFYAINDQPYSSETEVEFTDYYTITRDNAVDIMYDSQNPLISRLAAIETTHYRWLRLASIIMGIILIITVPVCLYGYRRQKRLAYEGRIIKGRLISILGKMDDEGVFQIEYLYEFMSPLGSTIGGTNITIRNDLKKKDLPPVNSALAILYVDEKCYTVL